MFQGIEAFVINGAIQVGGDRVGKVEDLDALPEFEEDGLDDVFRQLLFLDEGEGVLTEGFEMRLEQLSEKFFVAAFQQPDGFGVVPIHG